MHLSRLTRLNSVIQYLVNGLDLLIGRRMKDNDNGAYQANGAAKLS
jgi:hypothetical protein